jgi:hypothetical protein
MTDRQFLLLVLGLLYLSECLFWVRRGSVVFRRWLTGLRGGGMVHPSPGLGAKRTGLVWLHPLPPFGWAFVANVWPVSMSPEAAYSFVPTVINGNERPEHLGQYLPWEDIWKIARDGEVVWVNDKPFVRCNGEALARQVEAALREIKGAPAAGRERVIARWAGRATSVKRIARELRKYALFAGTFSPLRTQAALLFAVIFGWVPAAITIMEVRPTLLPSLAALAGLLALQGATFFAAHRRLYPEAAGARWRYTLTMILTPTASIRACYLLGHDLLAGYHPLAAALVLCAGREREEAARRVLLDYAHPMEPRYLHGEEVERAVVDDHHARLAAALAQAVETVGLSVGGLTKPPALQDPKSVAYCPRCDGEFIVAEGPCSACGGIALERVEEREGAGV